MERNQKFKTSLDLKFKDILCSKCNYIKVFWELSNKSKFRYFTSKCSFASKAKFFNSGFGLGDKFTNSVKIYKTS